MHTTAPLTSQLTGVFCHVPYHRAHRKEIFGLALAMLIIAKIGFGAAFTLVNLLVSRTFGPANASQVFGFLVSALTIAGACLGAASYLYIADLCFLLVVVAMRTPLL